MLTLRFEPVPYGFGPIGKAAHVARLLRASLGTQIRLHLVAPPRFAAIAEPRLFDAVSQETDTERADLVLSFMNRKAAFLARSRGERVVFVDSLSWLWDRPLELPDGISAYAFQAVPFLPVPPENLAPYESVAIGIPAIVHSASGSDEPDGTTAPRVMLSLAGIENFEVSLERGNAHYPSALAAAVRDCVDGATDAPALEVHGNRALVERAFRGVPGVVVGGGSQETFLRRAGRAGTVLLSPGLTSILELASQGTGFGLLPPQNYSQVRIAHRLRDIVATTTWDGEVIPWLGQARIPEVVGSQIMRALITEAATTRSDITGLADLLRKPTAPLAPGTARSVFGSFDGAAALVAVIMRTL